MTASRTLVFFLVALITIPALAGPTNRAPTSTAPRTGPTVAPIYTCSIVPAAVPNPGEFQGTSATARLIRGTAGTNKVIEIRLGTQSTGTLIGTTCTDRLSRNSVTATVTLSPPITNPNYNWACTAKQTNTTCQPPAH